MIYMAQLLLCLWLIIGANNVYAYCYATQWEDGIPIYSSLGVANGVSMESCQALACQIYPSIPECSQPVSPEPPACADGVEFQSLACQPNYSGAVNQSRTYYCQTSTYSDWVTTSDNCSPDPPTCQGSVQERQIACQDGYSGSITQTSTSQCPDPYGQPIFGAWVETQNSCQMTTSNPMNVNSPVSPISPVNQMNVEQPAIVIETPPVAQEVTVMQTTADTPKTEQVQSTSSESTTSTSQQQEVPKGKTLVQGFGLVMSLEILNAPAMQQEQTLNTLLEYQQELPYELRGNQDFLLQFIADTFMVDTWSSTINAINGRLLRYNEVQPNY